MPKLYCINYVMSIRDVLIHVFFFVLVLLFLLFFFFSFYYFEFLGMCLCFFQVAKTIVLFPSSPSLASCRKCSFLQSPSGDSPHSSRYMPNGIDIHIYYYCCFAPGQIYTVFFYYIIINIVISLPRFPQTALKEKESCVPGYRLTMSLKDL